MEIFIVSVFVLGYLAITLEHSLKIDKLIPALIMMALAWAGIAFGLDNFTTWFDSHNATLINDFSSLPLANEIGALQFQKDVSLILSEIYIRTNNYKEAYENHVLYKEFNDSIFNEENIKKITGLEYQYKHDKEKHAIELEQQKKEAVRAEKDKRQKMVFRSFTVVVILMSIAIFAILKSYREKKKSNKFS